MPESRWLHSAEVINGEVVIVGGEGLDNKTLKSSLIFNPLTKTFAPGPSLNQGRTKV